jgi:hypothetical protein
VTPEIGITATPVIDPSAGPHGTIYVVAMSKDGLGNYFQRLHALDLTTGAEEFGGPVTIDASFPGTGDNSAGGMVVFDPAQYKERPGLLLSRGTIYTLWSSHCDIRPYTGWIIAFNQTTLARTGVLNITPNGEGGAIWAAGAGPAADSQGNVYFLAGNGTFDTTLNADGFPSMGDFGNAFIKVSPTEPLHVADYFTMHDTVAESKADKDLGSGGAPEGVLAAAALRCIGGQMQCRLVVDTDERRERVAKMGIKDAHRKYQIEDMVRGDCLFAATGVTDGRMLRLLTEAASARSVDT